MSSVCVELDNAIFIQPAVGPFKALNQLNFIHLINIKQLSFSQLSLLNQIQFA